MPPNLFNETPVLFSEIPLTKMNYMGKKRKSDAVIFFISRREFYILRREI